MMTRVEMFREKLLSLNISDYHGLNSPGVTCYLNSVLQVLFMTEDFREAVKGCSSEDSTTIDAHLRRLFSDLEKGVAKTHNIIKKLGITNVYEQRDAAEYFEKILCRTSPEAAKMFKGELNHVTTCLRCMNRNDSRGFFWMLPLAVGDLSRQSFSVEKGLKAFFKGEKVCGDNKLYCNHCAKKQDAEFGCEMTQNPEVFILLLKRFTFDYKRRCYVKLHCKVDVPQFLHTEDCDYDLYALVNHFGNLTGGHYTAQIKSFETQVWYNFNDRIVKGVKRLFVDSGKPLRSSTAYLLMYRKVSRNPEKIIEGTQESIRAHSAVETGGRHEEAERGDAYIPCHQLKDKSCNGGENVKHLIGEKLKETYRGGTVSKAPLYFSWETEEQTCQRAAGVWSEKEMLRIGDGYRTRLQTQKSNSARLQKHGQFDTSSNEHMHLNNTGGAPTAAHCVDSTSEQNHTPRKKQRMSNLTGAKTETKTSVTDRSLSRNRVKHAEPEVGIGGKTEQRREAAPSADVHHYDVKSLRSQSSQSHPSGPLESKYSSNLCRGSNRSKKDTKNIQHVLTVDSNIRSVTKGEKSASPREKNAAKGMDKVKREPWK